MKLFLKLRTRTTQPKWRGGVLDGVTTDPSLVAKGGPFGRLRANGLQENCSRVYTRSLFSTQVTATNAARHEEGGGYASWHKHVVVKVPMTPEVSRRFPTSIKGIKTNTTLIFIGAS